MKKRFGAVALAMAAGCAVIFAGCTGCNGCGSNGKKNEAAFSSNWYADTNYRYIQPTFTVPENEAEAENFKGYEEITYTVTHDTKAASNSTYSVEYADGTYWTIFYAIKFDKSQIDEEFRGTYPDKDITVYCYATELKIPSVTFKKGEDTRTFKDNVVQTITYFMDVDGHLRPLYSEQTIDMVSPAELQVSSIEDAYVPVTQDIKTSYKFDGSAAKTVIEGDGATTFTTNLSNTDNSVIDVSGLNIAVRAMQLSTSLSQVISIYSPSGKMQDMTFAGSSTALGEEERKSYEGILAGKELYTAGEDKSLNTVCVTATLNQDMKGVSQQYWFTAIDNAKNNKGRATMVKMSVPLTFNLGTLNYSLNEIKSTLYH